MHNIQCLDLDGAFTILQRVLFFLFSSFYIFSSLHSQFFSKTSTVSFSLLVIIYHFRCVCYTIYFILVLFSIIFFFFFLLYFIGCVFQFMWHISFESRSWLSLIHSFITILIAAPKFSTVYKCLYGRGYIFKSVIFPFARSN